MLKSKQEIREKKKQIAEKLKVRALKPKKVKHNISNLKEACDTVFSLYIRFVRDKDKPCITCWRFYEEYDNWHFQVRQHMNTRYSELNTAKQCKGCNKWQLGEQVIFGRRIDETHWQGTSEALEIYARQVSNIKQAELLEIYQKYHDILVENKIPFTPIKKYLWSPTNSNN